MKTPPHAGPVLRVGAALALAAACFQVGRWTGQLEKRASVSDPGNEMVSATFHGAPEPKKLEEVVTLVAQGDPVGKSPDLITPLNVRDPSALVMGPGAIDPPLCVPAPTSAAMRSPAARKLKKEPLPEGRLLDLLRKKNAPSDQPKSY